MSQARGNVLGATERASAQRDRHGHGHAGLEEEEEEEEEKLAAHRRRRRRPRKPRACVPVKGVCGHFVQEDEELGAVSEGGTHAVATGGALLLQKPLEGLRVGREDGGGAQLLGVGETAQQPGGGPGVRKGGWGVRLGTRTGYRYGASTKIISRYRRLATISRGHILPLKCSLIGLS